MQVNYKICSTTMTEEECNQKALILVNKQQLINLGNYEIGSYKLILLNRDNAKLVEQYELIQNEVLEENSTVSDSYEQYLIYSCGEQQISFNVQQDKSADATIQISKYGYLTEQSCEGKDNQFCNITLSAEQQSQNVQLSRGLWRVNVHYTNAKQQSNIYFKQTEILTGVVDGKQKTFDLDKNSLCSQVYVYDLSEYIETEVTEEDDGNGNMVNVTTNSFYQYVRSIDFVSTFQHQVIDGAIEVGVYEGYPFTDDYSVTVRSDGYGSFASINLRIKQNRHNLYDKNVYVVVKAVEQEKQLSKNQTAVARILSHYNIKKMDLGVVNQQNMIFPIQDPEDKEEVEAATQRLLYNFYNEQVNISKYKNLNGNEELQMRYNYAFLATQSGFDTKLWVALDDINNNVAEKEQCQEITTDNNRQGYYLQFAMANDTDLADGKIQRFQPVYFTVQQYQQKTEQQEQRLQYQQQGAQTLAERLITIDPNTQFSFGSYGLTKSVNMKINVDQKLVDQGQVIIKAKGCVGSQMMIYWSNKNPLVSRYDYYQDQFGNQGGQPTAEAELTIPVTSLEDNIYVNVKNFGICSDNQVQVFAEDYNPQTEQLNTQVETTLYQQHEVKYMVSVNNNIRNQPEAYLRVEMNNADAETQSQIYGIITKEPISQDPQDVSDEIVLGRFYLNSTNNIQKVNVEFKNLQTKYIYVTFKNIGENTAQFKWQVTHPDELVNQQQKVAQLSSEMKLFKIQTLANDQVNVRLNINSEETDISGYVYICQQTIPFINQIPGVCEEKPFQGKDFEITIDNTVKYSGNIYLAVALNKKDGQEITANAILKAKINHQMSLNSINQIKLSNEKQYYYIKISKSQDIQQILLMQLKQSKNVVVCASFKYNQPEYYAWSQNTQQCEILIGNTSANIQQSYPLYKFFQFPETQYDHLYLTIVNLEGNVLGQDVIIRIDDIYQLQSDKLEYLNMSYQTNVPGKYPDHLDLMYELDASQLPENQTSSIVFSFNQSYPQEFMMTPFNVYVSIEKPIVTYINSNYTIYVPRFTGSIALDNNLLLQNVNEQNKVRIFIGVDLTEEMNPIIVDKQPVLDRTFTIGLETTNSTRIVKQLQLYSGKQQKAEFMMGNAGDQQTYEFNVSYLPMQIYLEVCQGNPTFKAGYSNFYYNHSLSDNATKDGQYSIWQQTDREDQDATVFRLASGTQNSLMTNYYFLVGDMDHDWKAKLYIGNTDSRPSAPIRTATIGSQDKHIKAKFSPSIKGEIVGDNSKLEYALFAIKDLKENQINGFNPKSSCGFLHGYQLTDFQTYGEYQTWYTMTTQDSEYEEIMNVLKDYNEFYITVVVRDPITNMTNMYTPLHTSYDTFPQYNEQEEQQEEEEQQNDKQKLSGGAIAGICIGVIAFVAIVAVVVVYLLKHKKTQKPQTSFSSPSGGVQAAQMI